MHFEWDEKKRQSNLAKHGFDFEDAHKLFDRTLWEFEDTKNDYKEKRMCGFGYLNGRLLSVIYTERIPDIIRIISFRKANIREVKLYEKYFKN
jgi:uncharacterized protein